MLIELSKIRRDGGTQPRQYTSAELVAEYAGEMMGGTVFPDVRVVFDGSDYWLVDGFHRVEAAIINRAESIGCEVLQGTQTDAQWMSFGVNAAHGQRRTRYDVQRAIKAALQHAMSAGLSDRAIAEHVKCDHKTVGSVRKQLVGAGDVPQSETRTGLDGRTTNVTGINSNRGPEAQPAIVVPEGGWPVQGENGEYDSALAEPIFHNHKKAQACLQVLQIESPPWKGGMEQWTGGARLTGVSGCELIEPLIDDYRCVAVTRDEAVARAAQRLAVHIARCLQDQDLLASRRECLDIFLDWAGEQGANWVEAYEVLEKEARLAEEAYFGDAKSIACWLKEFVDPRPDTARRGPYDWSKLASAIVETAGDADNYVANDAREVCRDINLIEANMGLLAAAIRERFGREVAA